MNTMAGEPARLQSEMQRIRQELAAAAVEHYPVLVAAADRAGPVAASTARGAAAAERYSVSLDELRAGAHRLQDEGKAWHTEKQRLSVAASSASRVAEILSAPATLESCIRSDLYHEARLVLEQIASLAESMPNSALIRGVAVQTHETVRTLLDSTVLPRLAGNLSVAAALKITTFLRHCGVADDDLRDAFLTLRTEYTYAFVAEEESASSGAPAALLKRLLVHWKVVVADAIATFTGCFGEGAANADAISRWALARMSELLQLWHRHLPSITSGVELADLAAEVGHCGGPWAAVGVDLSPLLLESLVDRGVAVFEASLQKGLQSALVALDNPDWRLSPLLTQNVSSGAPPPTTASGEAPTAPPRIVQGLPLAYLTHSLVAACNDTRRFAAVPAWPRCAAATRHVIDRFVSEVAALRDDGGSAEEAAAVETLITVTMDDCVPFLCRCVDFVFDRNTLVEEVVPAVRLRLSVRRAEAA